MFARYTPPTPVWARGIFAVIGLAALSFSGLVLYRALGPAGQTPSLGFYTPLVVGVVGLGCVYKSLTK